MRRLIIRGAIVSIGVAARTSQAQVVTAFPSAVAIGQQSSPLQLTVTMVAIGTPVDPEAVVQGIGGQDFSIAPGGSCSSDQPVTTIGQQCTVNVIFSPVYPGLRFGAALIKSADGSLLGSSQVTGLGTGSLAVLDPGRIDTVAGDSEWFYEGDGVLATTASIHEPAGIFVDPAGNLYLSDTENYRIRRVDARTQKIETIAGTGNPGYSGDGGLATLAAITTPAGLAMDGVGDIYFADSGNQIVRRIDVDGTITTVAGVPQTQGYSGDGGPATAAKLSLPEGVALDAAGDLYIADTGNSVIRKVDAATNTITTVAGVPRSPGFNGDGSATTSQLNSPWTVTVGPDNSLYIADTYNNRIRRISGGMVSTIAGDGAQDFGGDRGPAGSAELNLPIGVTLDPAGDLYIADSGNDRVRRVSVSTGNVNTGTATIQTIIGTGSEGFSGDGGPANQAALHGPYALFFAQNGDFYFADTINNRIRRVLATPFALQPFPDTKVTKISSPPQIEGVDSDGNADLNLSVPTLANAVLDTGTTTCSFTAATPKGSTCNLGVEFAPTTVAENLQGSVTLISDAGNTPTVIDVSGNGLNVNPTQMSITASPNPSVFGQQVIFTASVTNHGASSLSGAVIFQDGSTILCSDASLNSGSAICATSGLSLGQHTIVANYSGDANNEANTTSMVQVVKQQATLDLSVNPSPQATVLGNVTLTLTVTPPGGTATGSAVFYDGGTALSGALALNGSGVATFSTTGLTPGQHTLTAQYSGDTANASGTSSAVSELIAQATTTTQLGTTNPAPTVGDSITLTATVVTGDGPQPTGSVTFTDNGSSLGSAALDGTGTARLVLSSLTPGTHLIVANYSGNTDDATSASATLTETVAQIATITTLTTDANPLSAGEALHLTVTVTLAAGAVADGVLSGEVTFTDGGMSLGTASLDPSGHASFTLNALTVGSHALVAGYSGATNYTTSSSAPLVQQVHKTSTTVSVAPSATTVFAGRPVSFTATITSSTGIPTGAATLYDGSTALQTASLNAQGTVTFLLSSLSVGNRTLSVAYGGDANYSAGSSAPWNETVNLAPAALTLSGPADAVDVGTAVTLTGNLTSPGITPTGTLTLRDGTASIASQPVFPSSGFSFRTSSLPLEIHSLSVFYSGDSDNASAASPVISVTIQQAPTATALGVGSNPGTFGQPVILTASVVSSSPALTGSVTFLDGGISLGTVTLAENETAALTTTALSFGTHSITAAYNGDAQHAGSTSTVLGEGIVEPATATLASSLNPAVAGLDATFTATVLASGGQTPTGSIVFRDGGTPLGSISLDGTGVAVLHTSSLAVGSHIITVSYAGDNNVSAASASLTESIQSATTQLTLTGSANPGTYGTPLTLTASATSNGGSATGAVTFTERGASLGSVVLNGQENASVTLSTLSPGAHTIVANYAGDGRAAASVSAPLTVVVKQITSLALSSSSNPALTMSSITLTTALTNSGAANATGSVVFTEGTAQLGTAAVGANNVATLILASLPAGAHTITASYAGDSDNFASSSSAIAQVVNLRATTTTLTVSQTDVANPQQVTLIAVVHGDATPLPGGTISFSSGNLAIGTAQVDNTGVATLTILLQTSASAENIVASYSGDAVYMASTSASTPVQPGPATQFVLTIDPATVTIVSKQHTTINVSLASIKGFSDNIQFGCLGLPFAATCTFSTPQTKLAGDGTATVQLTLDTGNPLGIGAQASVAPNRRGVGPLLCLLPVVLVMSLSSRWRKLSALLLAMVAFTLTLSLSGCAGLQGSGTPPGTYTFKVTASAQGSGATQSQPLALTVTQ